MTMWDLKTNHPGGQKKNLSLNSISPDVMFVTANSENDLRFTTNSMKMISLFTQIRTIMPNFTKTLEQIPTNSFWSATVIIMQSRISKNTVLEFLKG